MHFPLHIVAGRRPGPTLLVVAGMSGLEIEPALILPQVVAEIDPAELQGTLLVVPLFNTSGFEFEQVNAIWDDKALQRLGRGAADGTVSEQLLHCFYEEVVKRADGVIDIRTGALWGYFRYAGVYGTGAEDAGGRWRRRWGCRTWCWARRRTGRTPGRLRRTGKRWCRRGLAVGRGCGTTGRKTCSGCGRRW